MKRSSLYVVAGLLSLLCAATPSTLWAAPVSDPATTSTKDAATTTYATVDTETSPNTEQSTASAADGTYERAIVQNVKTTSQATTSGAQQLTFYEIQFLSGPEKGQTRNISSEVTSNPYALDPRPGDKVLIYLEANPAGGERLAYLEGFERRGSIYWLLALFVFTMVLLAGWQGLKIAFSILLSILLIGVVLIPSFIKGLNPVPVTLALTVVLATVSSTFSIGWNRKALVTIIGTLGGAIVAYLIALVFADWAHLSGLSTDEDRLFFDKNPGLNPRGLMLAGIIIASMGVVEDVAVSIASGVAEVREANPTLTFKALFRSGMVIGRDHMAALANTLVFAYVGGSLSTLLLYTQYGGSWAKFINFDSVVDEIIRSLAGTIGLVFTVPITAALAAWFAVRSGSTPPPTDTARGVGWRRHTHSVETPTPRQG